MDASIATLAAGAKTTTTPTSSPIDQVSQEEWDEFYKEASKTLVELAILSPESDRKPMQERK